MNQSLSPKDAELLNRHGSTLSDLVDQLVENYSVDDRMHHLDATFLPSRQQTIDFIELMRRLIFPGFFDEQRLSRDSVRYHVGDLLNQARNKLFDQVRQALRYTQNDVKEKTADSGQVCDEQAAAITAEFIAYLPELRRILATDVQASFDGDPAATSTDEIIFCYPGLDAIFTQRIAHELYRLKVPLLPRILGEYAHNETGIDIHPGAQLGESFFIDHGTGVVIGETCRLGNRVKIYQGVTLGAISTKGGQAWRGQKRHPTVGNDVTIYGGAIILGDITIGQGCTIGGSVFLTENIPPHHTVTNVQQEIVIRENRRKKKLTQKDQDIDQRSFDFQI